MDKAKIKRSDFKHNFLDKGILRIDYSGVIDVEEAIRTLFTELYAAGFTSMNEDYIDEASVKLSDPVRIETIRSIPVEEFTKNKSYKFANASKNIVIEITKFFMTLTVDYENYMCFEDCGELFLKVLRRIKSLNNYIKPLRIGTRKINTLFIFDENTIGYYFEPPYYMNILNSMDKFGDAMKVGIHSSTDTFFVNNENVNLHRHMSRGRLIDEKGYERSASRIVLDIDCYAVDNEEVAYILEKDNLAAKLKYLNDISFDIYKQVLTESFIGKLISEEVLDENIIGVSSNV